MIDLAKEGNNTRIVMTTCSDERHPPENVLDGQERTFWVTTGLYPQEFVVDLGNVSKISKITTLSRNVRRLSVEVSKASNPESFDKVFEVDLSPRQRRLQTESQSVQIEGRYLKWKIDSGYENFATVNKVSILGDPFEEVNGQFLSGGFDN